MKTNIFFLFMILISANLTAQRAVRICGENIYHVPENVALEAAKQTSLERAKLAALADKFGTTITSFNVTMLTNENEKSDLWFRMLGSSEVKGEWIEDTKTPEYSIAYEKNMLVVKTSVCGNAREIIGAGVDFLAKVLKNGTENRFESENFKNEDDIFLLFRSPVNGYLSVYLIDNDQKTVYCMLPYRNEPTGKTHIKAGKDYVFFSKKHPDNVNGITDEYKMFTEKSVEQNFLYIIFSPNEFTKANDMQSQSDNVILPRELPFEDFQKWLAKNRLRDKDMKVDIKGLTIKKQ